MQLLSDVLKEPLPAGIKIKLPKDMLAEMKAESKSARSTMWLHGIIDGQFYLSPNAPDEKHRKLVRLPDKRKINELLKCQVVKIQKK